MLHYHKLFTLAILISSYFETYAYFFKLKHNSRTSIRLNTFTEPDSDLVTSRRCDKKSTDVFEDLISVFIQGWTSGLISGNITSLDAVLDGKTKWDNPFVNTYNEYKEGLTKFSEFFEEPFMLVFEKRVSGPTEFTLDYQMSFGYPAPWRPRIIIPATAYIKTSPDFKNILSVTEKWDVTVLQIFLKQFIPRFWDVWHVFCSPSPEFPPEKLIETIGKVSIVEIPSTVAVEYTWSGLAKYTGPPLLTVPGFCLMGELRTSRPNRDKYYTVLPVEVQSSRFLSDKGESMKRSSWIFHVPTALQNKVVSRAESGETIPLSALGDEEADDDLVDVLDYTVGLENLSVMKSVTAGAVRADFEVNQPAVDEFLASERKEYKYKILPKRTVAVMEIYGEATSDKIAAAIREIKAAVAGSPASGSRSETVPTPSNRASWSRWRVRTASSLNIDRDGTNIGSDTNQLGLQLCNVKGCFNMKGEPAMAIYEMQYSRRLTKVFLELEELI